MKRLMFSFMLLCSCDQKTDEDPRSVNCLDYANATLGMCFDAAVKESFLDCGEDLLEAAYNACNLALESDLTVCIPFRAYSSQAATDRAKHGCSGYVYPPAPKNWRGHGSEAAP
jgi:hypothetical protein